MGFGAGLRCGRSTNSLLVSEDRSSWFTSMTESSRSEGVIKTEHRLQLVWVSRNRKCVQINERRLRNENALIEGLCEEQLETVRVLEVRSCSVDVSAQAEKHT